MAGALLLGVEFGFALVELALPLFAVLPGLVQLGLPGAAGGRFEVEGVELGLQLGDARVPAPSARVAAAFSRSASSFSRWASSSASSSWAAADSCRSASCCSQVFEFLLLLGDVGFALIDPQPGVADSRIELRLLRVEPRFAAVDVG